MATPAISPRGVIAPVPHRARLFDDRHQALASREWVRWFEQVKEEIAALRAEVAELRGETTDGNAVDELPDGGGEGE